MTDIQNLDPSDAFAQLGRIRLGTVDIDGLLHQVADLAKRSISGATEVSVTLVRDKGAHTAAFTGEQALLLDEWQYEHGHGPCLEASESTATLSVTDMTNESRWPGWTARCVEAGAHSSLSIGMPIHDSVRGALNIYATKPDAFDDDAITVGQTFAEYAAVALSNAHMYDTQTTLAQHLRAAMEARAVIEQAKGIIMGERRCTADDAFVLLTKTSQNSNVKLRDVAAALVARAAITPKPWTGYRPR
jgi:GAF domain-containing protein